MHMHVDALWSHSNHYPCCPYVNEAIKVPIAARMVPMAYPSRNT